MNLPVVTMIDQIVKNTAQQMANKADHEIRQALDAALGDTWTIGDVQSRCVIQHKVHSGLEVLTLDGVPILEMYPLEFGPMINDGEKWTQTVTRRFRRLPFKPNAD